MKKTLLLLLLPAVVLLCWGCGGPQKKETAKLSVTASFYPMGELAKGVGGELIELRVLVPAGVEAHDFEPSPRAVTALGQSKVFVYNGLLEPWAQGALRAVAEQPVLACRAGEGLYRLPDGTEDPHVWLDLGKAQLETERICAAFCEADPAHADLYRRNAALYTAKLAELDAAYKELGRSSRRKTIVSSHAAFGHLAAAYGLKQEAVLGLSPEAEPTAAALGALTKTVRREGLAYIFMEGGASARVARTLAKEAGVKVLPLDAAEGSGSGGRSFLQIAEENLRNLKKALQ